MTVAWVFLVAFKVIGYILLVSAIAFYGSGIGHFLHRLEIKSKQRFLKTIGRSQGDESDARLLWILAGTLFAAVAGSRYTWIGAWTVLTESSESGWRLLAEAVLQSVFTLSLLGIIVAGLVVLVIWDMSKNARSDPATELALLGPSSSEELPSSEDPPTS